MESTFVFGSPIRKETHGLLHAHQITSRLKCELLKDLTSSGIPMFLIKDIPFLRGCFLDLAKNPDNIEILMKRSFRVENHCAMESIEKYI